MGRSCPLTREKIWWPAWFRIRDMWGDVAPDTITFEMMSRWRAALERKHGRGVAHKTLRVWRTFWKIMLGMKIARTADPSMGIRNRAPAPRWQRWSEGETVRLVKPHGAAAIMGWRALCGGVGHAILARRRSYAGCEASRNRRGTTRIRPPSGGRTKTGRAAIGTVSARTERIGRPTWDVKDRVAPGRHLVPNPNRQTRTVAKRSAHDFADVRALAFPGDKRRLMDMRRSGVVEAVAGDAGPIGLAAKLANSIEPIEHAAQDLRTGRILKRFAIPMQPD